jgi:hypothetical protein
MKKNVLNIFLSVAITVMTILCYKCFVGLCSPIRLETRYTNSSGDETTTYIFHLDGTFDEILNTKEETYKAKGVYTFISDRAVFVSYLPTDSLNEMKIENNGALLNSQYGKFYSSSHALIYYTILAVISEIVLIIIAFRVNDLERNALLELEREWPYMTEEEKEQHRQKFTAEYDEKTRRITAKYNDRMNKLNLSFTDTMSEEEKEQQRQSLTADYNDQMGRLTVKYRNTMNKLQ